MIAAEAVAALQTRLSEALHSAVGLGPDSPEDRPKLKIDIYSLSPVPDVSRMTGRHLADMKASLSWTIRLLIEGDAEGLLTRLRLVEAAAADIEARPVLGGEGWRADIVLESESEWAMGRGAAIGVRMRVGAA